MIPEIRNKLFDILVKMPPAQLDQYLQRADTSDPRSADPNAPPAYLVAAAMQQQKALQQAVQSPPSPQPTVIAQLMQEMSPPSSQGLGSLQPSIASLNPSVAAPSVASRPQMQPQMQQFQPQMQPQPQPQPQPPAMMAHGGHVHDYGVASLPYEADYKQGGVVAFVNRGFVEGEDEEDTPWFQMYGVPYQDPLSGQIIGRANIAPELGIKEYRGLKEANAAKNVGRQSVFQPTTPDIPKPEPQTPRVPEAPKTPPADPFADAQISLSDPRQEFLNRLRASTPTTGGDAGGFDSLYNKYSGILSAPAAELEKMAEAEAPKSYAEYMKDRQAADEAAGLDTRGYESRRADEIAGLSNELAANVAQREKFAKAEAWGALGASTKGGIKGALKAASNALSTYAEGMKGVMDYDTEGKSLIRKLRMNEADQAYARKVGDRDALIKLREKGEDLKRDLHIKSVDVGSRSNAAALRAATDQLNAARREAGANARQNAVIEAGLIKSADTAKAQLANIAARYGLSMAQITSRSKKDREATMLKLRQDPNVMQAAQNFAAANPNMKDKSGKPVNAYEYFMRGYAKDWFKSNDDLYHSATGGGYLLPGGISPVETEEGGEDGEEFDWERGF